MLVGTLAMLLVACAGTGSGVDKQSSSVLQLPEPDPLPGRAELYLSQNGSFCVAHVAIWNETPVRQGMATVTVEWRGESGELVERGSVEIDSLKPTQGRSKSTALVDTQCERVRSAEVTDAEWMLLDGWEDPATRRFARILGVSGSLWEFAWSEELQVFAGQREKT